MLVGAYLRREPYDLEFATNGKEAVAHFTQREYAIVLMDIQMPVMDGLTATQLIRKWEAENGRAPVPIIALTASALEEDVKRSFAAGCSAHVSKPVKKAVLIDALLNAESSPASQAPILAESHA